MSSDSAQENISAPAEPAVTEPSAAETSATEEQVSVAAEEQQEAQQMEQVASDSNETESGSPMFTPEPLNAQKIQNILEAALMAAGQPLSIDRMSTLFLDNDQPSREEIRAALEDLTTACENRGIELIEVGSGFRYQAKQENAEWVARLWEEKPARYSRALLETLALIAYRQPITRGEIEDIRGVSVSTNIMKTLMERDWVKVVGHRDVPGKPAMYASTKQFLDYFSLKGLSDLPSLAEIRDIDSINAELDLAEPNADKKKQEADAAAAAQLDLAANDVAEDVVEGSDDNSADETVADTLAAAEVTDEVNGEEVAGSDAEEADAEQLMDESPDLESSATEQVAVEEDSASTADPA